MNISALPVHVHASSSSTSGSCQASTSTSNVSSVTLTKKRTPSSRGWSAKGKGRSRSYGGTDDDTFDELHSILAAEGGHPRSFKGIIAWLLLKSPLGYLRRRNLTARSRTTNLAVLLLLVVLAISLLNNFRFFLHEHPLRRERDRLPFSIRATMPEQFKARRGGDSTARRAVRDSLNDPSSHISMRDASTNYAELDHLIIVAGHSVWSGRTADEADKSELWILQPGQEKSVTTYLRHVSKAAELAVADPKSLLVYSGGQTRRTAFEAEGTSYMRVAETLDLYRQHETPKSGSQSVTTNEESEKTYFSRAATETYALDSHQNLIFSICRFQEITGHYPRHITVVGFGMKRSRFTDVHREAIRWPLSSWTYIGIDDSNEDGSSYTGEKKYGLLPYQQDTYGCHGTLLAKRRARNPFRMVHPYFTSNPQLHDLLEYCPPDGTKLYSGRLPWTG